MTIQQVAERMGVSTNSLRFYEKIGLIPPVPRKNSGVREYDETMLDYIHFLLQLKKTGAPLEDILKYIQLAVQGRSTLQKRKLILERTRKNILSEIGQLQECLAALDVRLEHCSEETDLMQKKFSGLWDATAAEN